MNRHDVRSKQRSFLRAAFGTAKKRPSKRVLPPSLFLWGPSSTGKSLVLDDCLKESGIRIQLFIDSLEAMCGWRVLVQSILRQLQDATTTNLIQPTGRRRTDLWDSDGDDPCDSFISRIQFLLVGKEEQAPVVLVVDKAELLKDFEDDMLHTLLRLNEYTGRNFCVVLLSQLPWKFYSHLTEVPVPVQLHFPQYTEKEMTRIILEAPPVDAIPKVFDFYVEMVVKVYYSDIRNLTKVWQLVKLRENEFQGVFDNLPGDIKHSMLNNMWNNLKSILRKDYLTLKKSAHVKGKWRAKRLGKTGDINVNASDLPLSWVYLLIAAFVATVNHHSTDRRLFVKAKVSGVRGERRKESANPRGGIPHSRLLAIFCQMTEGKYPLDTCVISSLETLCRMDFMSRTEGEDGLDEPKYRLNLSQEMIQKLSSGIGLELEPLISQ